MTNLSEYEISSIRTQLGVCEDEIEKMSDWESEFIESISDQFTRNSYLSEKQRNLLKMLYDRVV